MDDMIKRAVRNYLKSAKGKKETDEEMLKRMVRNYAKNAKGDF